MPPKKSCGNPLFLSWMEELRDQAKAKGTKAAETYGKACKSLAACPVPYDRPRDLVVLQSIGPKTVQILEGKWKTYCEENGLPTPGTPQNSKGKAKAASPADSDEDADGERPGAKAPAKKRKTAAAPRTYVPAINSGGYGILLSLVLAIEQPTRNTQVFLTKSEVIRGAKPYCDSDYEHSEKGTYFTAWSSMKTLVNKGYVYVTGNPQKFCLTEEGYDVGCTIRGLRPEFAHIEKTPFLHEPVDDRVVVAPMRSNPALTARASTSHLPSPAPSPGPSQAPAARPAAVARPTPPISSRFNFWYIDSASQRVPALSAATIRLDPDEFVNLGKLEFRAYQKDHPFAKQLRLVDDSPRMRDGSGLATLFGFIVEDGAPPKCSKFDDETDRAAKNQHDLPSTTTIKQAVAATSSRSFGPPAPARKRGLAHEPIVLDSEGEDDFSTFAMPVGAASSNRESLADLLDSPVESSRTGAQTLSSRRKIHLDRGRLDTPESFPRDQPNKIAAASSSTAPAPKRARSGPRLSSHVPAPNPFVDPSDVVEPANLPDFDPSSAIVFPAGTYEIVLILDTREVESKTNRDKISEALEAKGVKVETRALRLGDILWIARRLDGLGGEEDECVLDYVVERKRLDDLCISIRDGRYTEQCFRLGNSCISHVYYIVEDWQVNERMANEGLQIMTAKSQIQVHNGFFLKETHRLSETIDYLATMTKVIASHHASQDLRIIPTRHLSRSTYGTLQAHLRRTRGPKGETYLTSFQAYQELNDKSASKTLKERFGRMLFCVKGMSAERVAACLDVWDTPKALWVDLRDAELEWKRKRRAEALESLDAIESQSLGRPLDAAGQPKKKKKAPKERGPDMFFADRVQGEGRRKIGDALSRELYRIFMGTATTEESLSDLDI